MLLSAAPISADPIEMEAAPLPKENLVSDEQLALRARAGSLASFEEIVRRYQVPLLRFLRRKNPGWHNAEDLLQDAFLRAYQSLHLYRDAWPFKTWIFTLTYRLAVSESRKRRVQPAEITETPSSQNSPLAKMQEDESRESLWQAARAVLSVEQFCALWLHYGESMPDGDIAQIMGRSWVWVKTNLSRSRKKLREALAGDL